ncbi:winged helix-turn-helix domain-containing protein [Microbispora sp. NPDC004025]
MRTRTAEDEEVRLLRWPVQRDLREKYRSRNVPRILIVEAGSDAPVCDDIYEDWVRAPIGRDDLRSRVDALSRRYRRYQRSRLPWIDDDVLRYRSRSTSVSPTQAELLNLLISRFGEVVAREALKSRLYRDCGGSDTRNALDLHMMRIRNRIQPLGLTLRTVWGRGYVLDGQPRLESVAP